MGRVIACDASAPSADAIDAIVDTLDRGEAVVMPTETQYSLSVRADVTDAGEVLRRIKKRKTVQAVAVFVQDVDGAAAFCEISETARRLAERFLPGPLTLVLPPAANGRGVSADLASPLGFGIRISSAPVIAAVMARVTYPVTATSANISGRLTPATVAEIRETLGDDVALYVDGGPLRGVVPSTVVHATETMTVLRHGRIAESELRRFLDEGD